MRRCFFRSRRIGRPVKFTPICFCILSIAAAQAAPSPASAASQSAIYKGNYLFMKIAGYGESFCGKVTHNTTPPVPPVLNKNNILITSLEPVAGVSAGIDLVFGSYYICVEGGARTEGGKAKIEIVRDVSPLVERIEIRRNIGITASLSIGRQFYDTRMYLIAGADVAKMNISYFCGTPISIPETFNPQVIGIRGGFGIEKHINAKTLIGLEGSYYSYPKQSPELKKGIAAGSMPQFTPSALVVSIQFKYLLKNLCSG